MRLGENHALFVPGKLGCACLKLPPGIGFCSRKRRFRVRTGNSSRYFGDLQAAVNYNASLRNADSTRVRFKN